MSLRITSARSKPTDDGASGQAIMHIIWPRPRTAHLLRLCSASLPAAESVCRSGPLAAHRPWRRGSQTRPAICTDTAGPNITACLDGSAVRSVTHDRPSRSRFLTRAASELVRCGWAGMVGGWGRARRTSEEGTSPRIRLDAPRGSLTQAKRDEEGKDESERPDALRAEPRIE